MKCGIWRLAVMTLLSGVASWCPRASAATTAAVVRTSDGHRFDLRAQRGHWVIVNFWATWCEACRDEIPMLAAFARSHPSVRMIGLTYERITPAALRQFVAAHRMGYPVARVDEHELPRKLKPTYFGIHALPLTYAIAPSGVVAKRWIGELNREDLQALIDKPHQ